MDQIELDQIQIFLSDQTALMEQLNSVIFQSNARLSGLTKHLNTSKGKDDLLFTSTR